MTATIFALVLSLCFLAFVVWSIRHHRLGEQTALLWLAVSVFMLLVSATLPLHPLGHAARLVGIAYPPDLLLLLAVLFLAVLVFHFSVRLARLAERETALGQAIGLLTALVPPESGEPDAGDR